VGALDEENAGVLDYDGADADERGCGEFALHGARILKRIYSCGTAGGSRRALLGLDGRRRLSHMSRCASVPVVK